MNLSSLETLLAAADTGSFSGAAERVGVTQAAVSMQMKALEESLGVALFDRGRRPLALSEAGLALLPKIRELVLLADALKLQAAGAALAGRLRLGVIPTAATRLVPAALRALTLRAPDLQIRITSGLSGELALRVAQGALDAALITETPRLERGLVARPVLEEPLVVIAPLGAAPPETEPTELLRSLPFIRFNRRAGVGQLIDAALRRRRVAVREAMELDSVEAILAMVAGGLGVAVVPAGPLASQLGQRVTALAFGELSRRVVLVERDRGASTPLTEALLEALVAVAGG
jgi:DNA-binding transcriptional LysR family regulator